jgi:NADPH-dependent 2,4-dienoyl-CoA reductase/sulfur reductase-like enzyme
VTQVTAQLDGTIALETSDGELYVADLVLVGTGVKPDDALAQAAGLDVQDGIVVDAQCRTSDPNIFAAGDATRFATPQGAVRLENWRHAQDHGAIAGPQRRRRQRQLQHGAIVLERAIRSLHPRASAGPTRRRERFAGRCRTRARCCLKPRTG